MGSDLYEDLVAAVGADGVLTDPDVTASYERDWTGRYRGRAALVVRPRDTAQLAEVVRGCARHEAAIVPQGGNTGLVGASVPRDGEVVISTTRMTEIGEIDSAGLTMDNAGYDLVALLVGSECSFTRGASRRFESPRRCRSWRSAPRGPIRQTSSPRPASRMR